jgi:hypothetical protein
MIIEMALTNNAISAPDLNQIQIPEQQSQLDRRPLIGNSMNSTTKTAFSKFQ